MPRGPNSGIHLHVHPVIRRLREERITSGMTQAYLAEFLGYGQREISRIEIGARLTRFQAIVDYADYYNLDLVLVPKGPKV